MKSKSRVNLHKTKNIAATNHSHQLPPCHCERMRGNLVIIMPNKIWIAAVVTLPRNDKGNKNTCHHQPLTTYTNH